MSSKEKKTKAPKSQALVPKFCIRVIDDVVANMRQAFLDDGVGEQALQRMLHMWRSKMLGSKSIDLSPAIPPEPPEEEPSSPEVQAWPEEEPPSPEEHPWPEEYPSPEGRPWPEEPSSPEEDPLSPEEDPLSPEEDPLSPEEEPPSPEEPSSPSSETCETLGTDWQLDGALDDSDEDDGNNLDYNDDDDNDELDDDAESSEAANSDAEIEDDEEPLNSDDDLTDDEDIEDKFDTDNMVACQYDVVSRSRNKWKFIFRDGMMKIYGKEFMFKRAEGDAVW